MAFLTGRIRPGEPTQAEALGLVIICAGTAVMLDLSAILAAMVMGSTVATLASHHDHPFKDLILPVVIGSTVIFEIIGPIITRHVLNKTGKEKT